MGNTIWSATASGPCLSEEANSIDCDENGNCYVCGSFSDTLLFDTTTLTTGSYDGFLVKYYSNGSVSWAKQILSSAGSTMNRLDCDSAGNCYLTGEFNGTALFGNINESSYSNTDMFVVRYDSSGNCNFLKHVGHVSGSDIALDSLGHTYIAGSISDTTNFDSYTLIPSSLQNGYWVKLDQVLSSMEMEKTENYTLVIYANPSQGECYISIPDFFYNDNTLTLSIYDYEGKVIQRTPVPAEKANIKIDLQGRTKGIYTAILGNGKKYLSGKFIIE